MSQLTLDPLPTPRLEIRWFAINNSNCVADYRIVISESDPLDIRSNDYDPEMDHDGYGMLEITGEINATVCNSNVLRYVPPEYGVGIEAPFRDGVHIQRDAKKLNLRAFVTYDGMAVEVFHTDDIGEDKTKWTTNQTPFPFKQFKWRKRQG